MEENRQNGETEEEKLCISQPVFLQQKNNPCCWLNCLFLSRWRNPQWQEIRLLKINAFLNVIMKKILLSILLIVFVLNEVTNNEKVKYHRLQKKVAVAQSRQ